MLVLVTCGKFVNASCGGVCVCVQTGGKPWVCHLAFDTGSVIGLGLGYLVKLLASLSFTQLFLPPRLWDKQAYATRPDLIWTLRLTLWSLFMWQVLYEWGVSPTLSLVGWLLQLVPSSLSPESILALPMCMFFAVGRQSFSFRFMYIQLFSPHPWSVWSFSCPYLDLIPAPYQCPL